MQLRPYQQDLKDNIYEAWAHNPNILAVLPTGGGKTVIFSDIIKHHDGPVWSIAHRQELVVQMSLTLAREGVKHKIIGPNNVIKLANRIHIEELGRSFYSTNSNVSVAGVDTIKARKSQLTHEASKITLCVQDEAHHVLKDNKWGNAFNMCCNAKVLGVTATPLRADGKGLGMHNDGIFHQLVVGPGMRDIINMGYLTDYRIFAPASDIDVSQLDISGSTGDYKRPGMVKALEKSHIVGDVVDHYLRLAPGKLGITFAPNVDISNEIAEQFNASGVPAAVVSAKTPDRERINVVRRFRRRELMQLVNVDVFGEGFDLPAIEAVSFARPTASYGLYCQQFGRGLRILEGKTEALIIDHVSNVIRQGLPDAPRKWSLEPRDRRARTEDIGIKIKVCINCSGVFEAYFKQCPYCAYVAEPVRRDAPEFVDGDLSELSIDVLAKMRGEADRAVASDAEHKQYLIDRYVPHIGQLAGVKRHRNHRQAQHALRDVMALWAGYQRHAGLDDSLSYRRFYTMFGIDVLTAQTLKSVEAVDLINKLCRDIAERM